MLLLLFVAHSNPTAVLILRMQWRHFKRERLFVQVHSSLFGELVTGLDVYGQLLFMNVACTA